MDAPRSASYHLQMDFRCDELLRSPSIGHYMKRSSITIAQNNAAPVQPLLLHVAYDFVRSGMTRFSESPLA
jgi:hypothetical protein